MEWEGREESENVEDRRGVGKKTLAIGGGAGILVVILGLIFGVDPQKFAGFFGGQGPNNNNNTTAPPDPAEEKLRHFSSIVFRDTEVVWEDQFRKMGKEYKKPVLVLFSEGVQTGCGEAGSAVGPFYCPADSKVYIDLSFYKDMERKLNAPGDFARAYVIAHEVGHHVQRLLGYHARGKSKEESVRLELQADFLAGVWAHYARDRFRLNAADIESALHAAYEIGDDRLQKKATGHVMPDSFTHGTSQQRMRWFKEGYDKGDVNEASKLFDLPYDRL